MPERGTIHVVFILRRMQEENHAKGKTLYMCLVDKEKASDRVPRKVLEWAMSKKEYKEYICTSSELTVKCEPKWTTG